MSKQSDVQGVIDGKLAPCPKTANCVSTEHTNPNRYMLPIEYKDISLSKAKEILVDVLKTIPKLEVKKIDGPYIYAEAKTMIFEFFHDVEFYFDDVEKLIHFRSASRMGFADLGTNKRRMQSIVARFYRQADQVE
ncbi:hypothetical protein GCM10011391_04340 [Pullulanibacillus camelliae]|uniref:DUF1499 domain-containing protein n=1 Tax=Pullulanibacillus camelliae TaxID=1707096 RepID=A0A8J2VKF6_9BACL|nr:DUF1499 domain-containing protein [Pullulanibacillus camelliae]GGE28909.1 hypothetical protein GCM10011391_04340 [Pullulanibacillus camelliae]